MAMDKELLLDKARAAKKKAYSPYSKFNVGAAIQTLDGKVFTGCNVENSSYGLTVCAERIALFKAVSEGHTSFNALAISASENPAFPCGACRQVLSEFGKDMTIYLDGAKQSFKLSDLIPHAFSVEQMNDGAKI